MAWVYLSLGSNIMPQENMTSACEFLAAQFPTMVLFPVIETAPCAMESEQRFLNTLAIVQSNDSELTLKTLFNRQEELQGRDRSDPERGIKDRPIDIDILGSSSILTTKVYEDTPEPYCQACVTAAYGGCDTVSIPFMGELAGDCPTAIYTDTSGRHVFIREQTMNRLFKRLEAAFNSEQRLA